MLVDPPLDSGVHVCYSCVHLIILSVGRDVSSAEEEKEEGNLPPKKKKKKSEKKRKKKKKHKKKSGRYSDSSGTDSETVFPSDLKREQESDRYGRTHLHHTRLLS